MKKIFSLFMILSLVCFCPAFADGTMDEELFPVKEYIDNWSFDEGSQPVNSWQKLPQFTDGFAVFDTSNSLQHPCFDSTSFKNYIDEKYIVMDFSIMGFETFTVPFRIINIGSLQFFGSYINVPGYGRINLDINKLHRITFMINMQEVTLQGNKVMNMKPHMLYVDGELKTMTAPNTTFETEYFRTWIEIKAGINKEAENADVIHMGHYRTYVKDVIVPEASTVKEGDIISSDTGKIELQFSHSVDADSVSTAIVLKKDNGTDVATSVLTEDKKVTVSIEEELEYGRNYILTVAGVKTADLVLTCEVADISFYTENQPLYDISEIDGSGAFTVTSCWPEARNIALLSCFYDAGGKLIKSQSTDLSCEYQIPAPANVGSIPAGAKTVRIFVFDEDFKNIYKAFGADINSGVIEGVVNY